MCPFCRECWSLSSPHSTAVCNRVACTMLNWVGFTPAPLSHTCWSCVHHSLCPTCKLHQSDNLLRQQTKPLWSPESQPTVCAAVAHTEHPESWLSQILSHTDVVIAPVAVCTELLFDVPCVAAGRTAHSYPCWVRHRHGHGCIYLNHNQSC